MIAALLAFAMQPSSWPACSDEAVVCEAPLPPESELRAVLGRRAQAYRVRGGILTVVARREKPARLCCALQGPLRPVAGQMQAIALRVAELESAVIDIRIATEDDFGRDAEIFRGPEAPPAPPSRGHDAGRFTLHNVASRHLGESRDVYVFVPANIPPGLRLPAVYLGDGLPSEFADIADELWTRGQIAPVILIGIQSSRRNCTAALAISCDGRSLEYLVDIPDLPPEQSRFEAHARFVMEEVVPLMEASFPIDSSASARVVGGFSSGGAWALAMAARYPETFGGTIAMSVGYLPAALEAVKLRRGRVFIGGGRLEDRFHLRSVEAATAATRAGADVRLVTPNAGHSMENWAILFADALRWHFPPAQR